MTIALVEDILRGMQTVYGQYKVYLLGGEPTTHPDLVRFSISVRLLDTR